MAVKLLLVGASCFLIFNTGIAQTIYVDGQLMADCIGNYSVANRNCSGSDGNAYRTLAGAAAVATAGTTVLIREGVYHEQLSSQHSGTSDKYITFKNYSYEIAEISGETLSPAIWIDRKDYIVIEGLHVRQVRRWLNALGSDYLVIKDNVFEHALDAGGSSKTGLFFQACNYARIIGNKLHDTTQDNLVMVDCDYNLIEGNSITRGAHALWALKCSHFNIIRNNYFHNEIQKIGEIYDCYNAGYGNSDFPKITSVDDTKYNLVEGNIFAYTPFSGNSSPYAGIQYAGQHGIIRFNVFYECVGPPVSLTVYGREAENNYGNRICHNVFYNNKQGGINISGSTSANFDDQVLKNNIWYKNTFVQTDMRWDWYAELNNKPVQILTGRRHEVLFDNNAIFSNKVDELYVIAYGARSSASNPPPETISWWETNYRGFIRNTIQADPMFVDPDLYDFHLRVGSPVIDAGTWLAYVAGPGSNSTQLVVDDAGWFIDGFGIRPPDTLQFAGQSEKFAVVSIDYTTRTITIDKPTDWANGTGVSLAWNGAAPDLGAFEYDPAYQDDVVTALNSTSDTKNIAVIYPNPFQRSAVLVYHQFTGDPYRVDILNNLGQVVQQIDSIQTRELTVHRQGLPAGVYVYHLYSGNYLHAVGKFIIE